MPLLPAFRKHRTDAAYIARLIAGYGQMEFMTGHTLGNALAAKRKPTPTRKWRLEHRTHYEKVGHTIIYRIQGAEKRLKKVKSIARSEYTRVGLEKEFVEVFSDLNKCREIRNLFAHAIYDYSAVELYIGTLEEDAKEPGVLAYSVLRVPRRSLKEIERFFWGALPRLQALNEIFAVKAELTTPPAPSMPVRPSPLREYRSLFPVHRSRLQEASGIPLLSPQSAIRLRYRPLGT